MNTVVRQAISPDLDMMLLSVTGQQLQIGLSVLIIKEYRFAVVAALGDVMRVTGCYDAGYSWHG
jgi:hypothetical protein